jgi:hypothetical protein
MFILGVVGGGSINAKIMAVAHLIFGYFAIFFSNFYILLQFYLHSMQNTTYLPKDISESNFW